MNSLNLSYEDLQEAARQKGVYDQISAYDWQLARQDPDTFMLIVNAKYGWNNATTAEEKASYATEAEAARALYNYSGGSWGSEYIPLSSGSSSPGSDVSSPYVSLPTVAASVPTFTPVETPSFDASAYQVTPYTQQYSGYISSGLDKLTNQAPFSYDKSAPEYTNQYSDQIASALNNVTNYGPFTYDKNADPLYSAYAQQYRREGERASRNALAQAATRSGGANSSATIAASQQAGNYYGAQLSDKIPGLYQQAYNQYADQFNRNLNVLGALNQQEQYDYDKYRTDLSQYNADRNFSLSAYNANTDLAYQQLQGALAAEQNAQNAWSINANQMNQDRNFAYGMTRDAVSDAQWNANQSYGAQMDAYNAAVDQQKLKADIAQYNATQAYNTEADNRDYLLKLADEAASLGNYDLFNQLLSQAGGTGTVSLDSVYALKNYGSGGSSGGSGGGSLKSTKTYTPAYEDTVDEKIEDTPIVAPTAKSDKPDHVPADVVADLRGRYTYGEITNKSEWDKLVSTYGAQNLAEEGLSYKAKSTSLSLDSINGYDSAINYMKSAGVSASVYNELLSPASWLKEKNGTSSTSALAKKFTKYVDYARAFASQSVK